LPRQPSINVEPTEEASAGGHRNEVIVDARYLLDVKAFTAQERLNRNHMQHEALRRRQWDWRFVGNDASQPVFAKAPYALTLSLGGKER
jgi:hypothetical protein